MWEIQDNGYSAVSTPCLAERLMWSLFLDTSVLESLDPEHKYDAGNETNLPAALLSWQSGPFHPCSTF